MARSFNGSTDFIDVTTNAGISPTSTITVACWAYFNNFTNYQMLIVKPAASTWTAPFADYQLRVNAATDSSPQVISFFVTSSINGVNGGTTLVANTWYHLAATFNGTTELVYVNGAQDGTGGSATPIGANGFDLHLGWDQTGTTDFFNGRMADVAIWNVVLTAGEISALAKGARPRDIRAASTRPLWLPLSGLQSPEPDLSGFANNGTLTGTANASGPPTMQFTPRWPRSSLLLPTAGLGWIINRRNKLMVPKKRA